MVEDALRHYETEDGKWNWEKGREVRRWQAWRGAKEASGENSEGDEIGTVERLELPGNDVNLHRLLDFLGCPLLWSKAIRCITKISCVPDQTGCLDWNSINVFYEDRDAFRHWQKTKCCNLWERENELMARRNGIVTKVVRPPSSWKEYFAIKTGWFAKYLNKTLQEKQDCYVRCIGKECDSLVLAISTSAFPAGQEDE